MGGEILAVTGSQSPALLSSARRSVLDRATAPQSSALRNPDTRWGSHGDLRPLMGAEVVTPEEPHPFPSVGRARRRDDSDHVGGGGLVRTPASVPAVVRCS